MPEEPNLARLTLRQLAKAIFQLFGLTSDQPIGFDLNGQFKNVDGGTSLAKASGAEVTTGTNDAKYVTPKAIADSQIGIQPKRYVALLSQTGTDAPVATVLENTLGRTVDWAYETTGQYTGTPSTGSWDADKTVLFALGNKEISSGNGKLIFFQNQGPYVQINTGQTDFVGGSIAPADGILHQTSIEIRVYL
jgi:hypothetical protein